MQFTLHVNDRNYTVDVDSDTPLLWVLRDEIDLKAQNSAVEWVCAGPVSSISMARRSAHAQYQFPMSAKP